MECKSSEFNDKYKNGKTKNMNNNFKEETE